MRISRVLFQTTGIVGIPVHHNAKNELFSLYENIQHSLERFPSTSAYRTGTEAIVKQRCEILSKTEDVKQIEEEIGLGQMEELILQAQKELKLIRILEEDKPWEPLEVEAPPGQWVGYTKTQ